MTNRTPISYLGVRDACQQNAVSSLEAVTVRSLRKHLGKEKSHVKEEPEGVEYWKVKDGASAVILNA
jgi:hypothetical protein